MKRFRIWCLKFGPDYARKLKRRQGRLGDIWHLDEVFIRINGKQQYLWRAVDQDGDLIDILVQRGARETVATWLGDLNRLMGGLGTIVGVTFRVMGHIAKDGSRGGRVAS